MNIHRNAHLTTPNGDAGQVVHVIVNPRTHEVTDLVVQGQEGLFTLPITAVEPAEGGALSLRPGQSIETVARPFANEDFSPLDADTARDGSDWLATNGGAPLLNADADAVHVGDVPAARTPVFTADGDSGREWRLQLKEERLIARAVPEQAGVVRIGRKVVERTETVEVPVREEWLIVELKAGGGHVSVDGRELAPGEVVEIPIYQERAVANTEVVLAEDVTIRKDAVQYVEPVTATVRSERLAVDDPVGVVRHGSGFAGDDDGEDDDLNAPRVVSGSPDAGSAEWDGAAAGRDGSVEPGLAFEAAQLRAAQDAAVAGVVPTGPQITGQTYADFTDGGGDNDLIGLPLVTADGEALGTIGEVLEDRFRVNAPLARDYWLPRDLLAGTAPGGDLVVNVYKDDLDGAKVEAPAG